MKATKFLLVIAIFAFATMSYSSVEPAPKKVVKISLKKAMDNPYLVKAIYKQVDPRELISPNGINTTLTARVTYNHTIYLVTGLFEEWVDFFYGNLFDEVRET